MSVNPRLSVIGAEWCPHSRNQAEALGCTTTDGQTTCKAKHEDDTPVTFVYCQDKNQNQINQDHPLCRKANDPGSKIQGYPAWLENGEVSEKLGGFMNPCDVKGLNENQLNCAAYKDAQGICMQAQEESKTAMKEFEQKYQDAQKKMVEAMKPLESQVKQLEEEHMKPVALKIQAAVEPLSRNAWMHRQQPSRIGIRVKIRVKFFTPLFFSTCIFFTLFFTLVLLRCLHASIPAQ